MAEEIIKVMKKTDLAEEEIILNYAINANYVLYASPESAVVGTIDERLSAMGY